MQKHLRRIAIITLCLAAAALNVQSQGKAHTYTIVPGESSFWVFVPKAGLLSSFGHDHNIGVKSFSGKVVVPEAGTGGGSLELEVNAQSLVLLDTKPSEEDRKKITNSMHNEVLESAKYQKISFKSVSISDLKSAGAESYTFTLNGDLTLHGVTKRIALPVNAKINAQQLRAGGKYTLKQSDFGIKPFSAVGGAVKVKNEVVVNFDIVAKA